MGIEGHEHAASLLNRYNVVRALTDEETGKVKVYVRSQDDARWENRFKGGREEREGEGERE
jgi:hypothetical protein